MSQAEQWQTESAGIESLDEFADLLKGTFRPRTDDAVTEAQKGVKTLVEMALKNTALISNDATTTIRKMIEDIDEKLSAQINEIIHHDDFQRLEGAWRGLKHLLDNSETGTDLKIKVMHITKDELATEVAKPDWDHTPLFRKIYEDGYGVLDGDPVASIVADFHFNHNQQDVKILQGLGKIAAATHAPLIAGAAPSLLDMDDWAELPNPKDLAGVVDTPQYQAWQALRESDDARYIGLAMPRFLSRIPYGEENPVKEFNFKEDIDLANSSQFCWSNAAYAMAANITRAFKIYGWCSLIRGVESGGLVENLPTYSIKTDTGGYASQCPTEVSVTDRRELELANLGLMPLVYKQNSNAAAFLSAQSLHKPKKSEGINADAANKNAQLGARLPYLFACARFAHYLKHMVRNKVGSYMERDDMEDWLTSWINNYVASSASPNEAEKARQPLKEAKVTVVEVPGNPGMYAAKFHLRPHYQLEGTNVSLSLVSRLPADAQ